MNIRLKKRHLRKWAIGGLAAAAAGAVALALLARILPSPLTAAEARPESSLLVTDREGRPLREVLPEGGARSRWVSLDRISPHLVHAFLVSEDRRFFSHPGVDPIAVARAVALDIRRGRIVSGGSTLTQQLARALRPRPRTFFSKALEAFDALRLEAHLEKDEILEQYLNRIPFGNRLYGVDAASRTYLKRPPASLTAAEAAFLAVIPRAPTAYNPYRNPKRVIALRDRVLGQMRERGFLDEVEYGRALAERPDIQDPVGLFRAPHFVEHLVSTEKLAGRRGAVRTTLDLPLQSTVERALRATVGRLEKKGVGNAAVVVIENETRAVLAWVGSRDFFDPDGGQVDGVLALRQPGSTMKPFTYALALEHGLTPAAILPDLPMSFSTAGDAAYTPDNYDHSFRGPVRLRVALGNSLNVPAIATAKRLDLAELLDRLHALGIASLDRDAAYYGLGLTLGNGEVALLELANAYASLAARGVWKPPRLLADDPVAPGARVFDERIAAIVTDILSDDSARALTFGEGSLLALPFPAAAKTGTSKNFRDNWTVGFTPEVTAGVWVGNFDGDPMHGVSGITGAGPLWNLVMQEAMKGRSKRGFPEPEGIVLARICPLSGALAGPACPSTIEEKFVAGNEPHSTCEFHRVVPVDEATGEPLPAACSGLAKVAYRVFEAYPPEYEDWAKKAGRPLMPAAASEDRPHAACAAGSAGQAESPVPVRFDGPGGSPFRIRSPLAGQILAYDPGIPRELQNLELKALVPAGRIQVVWMIDGAELPARTASALWPIERGEHTITASAHLGERITRDEVRIVVR